MSEFENNNLKDENKAENASLEEKNTVSVESINEVNDTTEKAILTAENFAKKLGLENMKSVWSASSQEICYINLAPIIDDIVMYPDLIKVKIDLKNYSVVGWESSGYAYNHIERDDLIPTLSENDAKRLVSQNLKIENQRLCVIPLDYVGEVLAYEFEGEHNGFKFYLYIDAENGSQVRVLKVVQTEQGELVL